MSDRSLDYESLLAMKPYSLKKEEKRALYGRWLTELTDYHRVNCGLYDKLLTGLGIPRFSKMEEEDILMLPVGFFKDYELKSIKGEGVFKTITSSGTSTQKTSKIYLDADNARYQQMALVNIGNDFWGEERLPLLVIDSPEVLKNRQMFSARGAGILGFSIFASRIHYALDRDMKLDKAALEEFTRRYRGKKVLVFGFTYMIWEYFYKALAGKNIELHMPEAVLLHGGGWKKLQDQAVSTDEFKEGLRRVSGIEEVYNYYGMAEQTGCIYMECPCGHLHASLYSDIIIRRPADFGVCGAGEKGIVQVLSPLAHSYPGHSILTEDEGVLLGEDDCPCGRLGKYFKIIGRIQNAEVRGCSDTYEG